MYRRIYLLVILLFASSLTAQTTTSWQGTSVTIDSYMAWNDADANFGTATTMSIANTLGSLNVGAIKFTTILDSLTSDAVALSCTLRVYVVTQTTGVTLFVERACKPFTEAGVTHNDWDGTNAWTTGGGQSAGTDCADCDNSGNGSGDDKVGTIASSATTVTGAWSAIVLDTCHVNDWIRGDDANNGLLIRHNNSFTSVALSSSERSTEKPEFIVVWDIPGVPTGKHGGVKHSADGATAKHGG